MKPRTSSISGQDVDYLDDGFTPFVTVKGAKSMFIGDSPSKQDLKNGVPFSGDGALVLFKQCKAVDIAYENASKVVCLDYWPSNGEAAGVIITSKKQADLRRGKAWKDSGVWVDQRTYESFERTLAYIEEQKPDRILVLGGVALLCVMGETSIHAWRGSCLEYVTPSGHKCHVIPTYHPSALSRKRSWTVPFIRDLQRFAQGNFEMPKFNLHIEWTADQYEALLVQLLFDAHDYGQQYGEARPLAVDLETRAGYTTVCGIAWSARDCVVIPFTSIERVNYFTVDEELRVVKALKALLESPYVRLRGQNFQYDVQYFASNYGIKVRIDQDTMVDAHAQWTKGLELGLSFLASLYCEWYRYWKEDGKQFHESFKSRADQITYWRYNGFDCCYTFEIGEALDEYWNAQSGKWAEVIAFQRTMQNIILTPVLEGIRFDRALQQNYYHETVKLAAEYEAWFEYMIPDKLCAANGKSPWWNSPTKLSKLLYVQLGIQPVIDRKTKRPTTGGDAPKIVGQREPLLARVMEALDEYRSIEQFISLYLKAMPSADGRMRTQYMIGGTDTFRLASKKDAFDRGLNLQNITSGK
jgi:uracil-DNA glycosylase